MMDTQMKIRLPEAGEIDAASIDEVKAFHRAFPTGVTIVTARGADGTRVGLAVNAFSSVSMEPPTALVCINRASQSHEAMLEAEHIGVSVLANDQLAEVQAFARSGGDKFSQVTHLHTENGTPLISGAAAALEMRVMERIEAATHTIFVGVIVAVENSGKPSLVYQGGKFFDGSQLVEV